MAHENPHLEYATGFDDLVSVVESVEHPGSFFIPAAMTTPMPWLQVEDAGTLSFPLPAEQCRRLIETVATKAPYCRGGETVLDESVRKVRQIGAEQISLGGLAWAPILAELLAPVAAGLGVPVGGPCKERLIAALDRFAGWSPVTEPVRSDKT